MPPSYRLFPKCVAISIVFSFASTCNGQVRAIEKGSAEAASAIEAHRRRMAEQAAAVKKATETGEAVFGKDDRWDQEQFKGTLFPKSSADYRIGDWGRIQWIVRAVNTISDNEVLVAIGTRNPSYFVLRGLDTSKVTDDIPFMLQHPVAIKDTYTYTTVAGSEKTVLVFTCGKAFDEWHTKAEANAWAERWATDKHTWTDKTGAFSVEAVYDDYVGKGNVRLLREDKSEIVVSLSRLSESDRRKILTIRRAAER